MSLTPEQRQRLLKWTEDAIREWNWPLVEAGEITHEELNEDIALRNRVLNRLQSDALTVSVLYGLPDELFHRA